jgi:predicted enzyme related to lactoylglutathione lyase
MAYITVDDVDATMEKAKSKGATVIAEPRDIPNTGRLAVMRDPKGALIAVYKPANDMPGGEPAVGQFSWHELSTTDHTAAFDFYSDLFGWEKMGEMDMGGTMGIYQMFGANGQMLGGMMNKAPENPMPPNWLLYVRVNDVRAAVDSVKRLGGQVLYEPMEVPGGDEVSAVMDPQGTAFGLHQKKS